MKIWGIINITPDSFVPESRKSGSDAVHYAEEMLSHGADVVDLGAESSRPFSTPLPADEEWSRLEPPLKALRKSLGDSIFSTQVSVDTWKPEIAQKCLDLGVGIINDIRAGQTGEMLELISRYKSTIVLMHSQGTPETMQVDPRYDNVTREVFNFLNERSNEALKHGISKDHIIWDFGIGFGKTTEHNLELLQNIDHFCQGPYPIMAGVSRKSFIGKLLGLPDPKDRKEATMILHTYLALHRVSILRVHDIEETVLVRKLTCSLYPGSLQ